MAGRVLYGAEVKIPQVTVEASGDGAADENLKNSVDKINLDIKQVTQELIDRFEVTVQEMDGGGHVGLNVDNEVVMDNDRWFTLKMTVLKAQDSGCEYMKYYTVAKQTGGIVTLRNPAPGYMGVQEFVIPQEVTVSLLK